MQSPFRISPNPNLMHMTPGLRDALDNVRFMVRERQGLAVILADNGIGKSTVLRYLLSEYSAEGYTTGLLNQTEFPSPYAFLKAICSQFSVEPKRSQVAQHAALEEWLIQEFQADRTVVLFIDEGQRLNAELLEVIRSLLNFETYEDKLLQIILCGTLELRDNILAKRNKALHSRVFAACHLNPMSPENIAAMLRFRCEHAGVTMPFDDDAVVKIHEASRGIPRTALALAAHAWNQARTRKINRITVEMVETARASITVKPSESAVA